MRYTTSMVDSRELLQFENQDGWRRWLLTHHRNAREAWLVLYKKGVRRGALSLDEAVETALCYGWIDGKLRSFDAERYTLRFTPRRPDSVWSMSNIRRIENLIKNGMMTEAGLERVKAARENGQWAAAIEREQTDRIPPELAKALRRKKGALDAYRSLKNSRKKQLLYWLSTAKRDATRIDRIEAIVKEVARS